MDAMTVQIAKLELKAGETLVVMLPQVLPAGAHDRVRAMFQPLIPEGVKCIVLDGGVTLAKMVPAE